MMLRYRSLSHICFLSFYSKKLQADMGLPTAGPTSTSQYVKQELRNICNARSEKQMQQQTQMQQHLLQQQHQQQLQQAPQPMQRLLADCDSELPPDILETSKLMITFFEGTAQY